MTNANDLRLDDYRQDRRVARWLSLIGVTNAHTPRENVKTALRFLEQRLPLTHPSEALSFLIAMDLSKIVSEVTLAVGTQLIGFRESDAPRKGDTRPDLRAKFFAFPGASPHRLGIRGGQHMIRAEDDDKATRVGSRKVVHYKVHTGTRALSSYASGALDFWTEESPSDNVTSTFAAMSLGATGMHPTFSSPKLNVTGVHATGGDRQLLVAQAWRYVEIVEP